MRRGSEAARIVPSVLILAGFAVKPACRTIRHRDDLKFARDIHAKDGIKGLKAAELFRDIDRDERDPPPPLQTAARERANLCRRRRLQATVDVAVGPGSWLAIVAVGNIQGHADLETGLRRRRGAGCGGLRPAGAAPRRRR
jgi:hypothetical protein